MNIKSFFPDYDGYDFAFESITDSSQSITPDTLFVVRPGPNGFPVQYAEQALEAGAVAVLTPLDLGVEKQVLIPTLNHVEFLQKFYNNKQFLAQKVAVTGTNGKTTISFLVDALLQAHHKKGLLLGTVANRLLDEELPSQLTTPGLFALYEFLNKASTVQAEYCVMEASSHAIEQKRLGELLFDVTIFTNLSQDHLDYHKTMDAYYQAKKALFVEHCSGKAIVNTADDYGKKLHSELDNSWSYAGPNADFSLVQKQENGFLLQTPEGELFVETSLVGDFNTENIMAAIAAGMALGIPKDILSKALATVQIPGRLEKVWNKPSVLVDYAHTPDALERVLASLQKEKTGRLLCLFGCGGDRDPTKRVPMAQAAEKHADFIVLTSDNPRTENPEQIVKEVAAGFNKSHLQILDREEAIKAICQEAQKEDTVLIAGKGHEDYQILATETISFDDRLLAKKHMEALCK